MDELILHSSSRAILEKKIQDLPHALLLIGKQGVGVGEIAHAVAIRCGSILETIFPKKRQTNGSYDVDMDAGSIIIDDIRSLYIRTRSKFTSPQIVIIDFSGRPMSHAAQNAFLKLLEEPQKHIHFILATSNVGDLLPTVLSRAQRIDIQQITHEQSQQLIQSLQISDETKATRILFIAEGLPSEIKRLASNESYYEARVKTVQDARIILGSNTYERLKVIQAYKDKRSAALQLLDDAIHQLQLSAVKTVQPATLRQLDSFAQAHEKIQANGNIQLNLAKVLL
ncbi:hypothetical protein HY312_03730 [Candidatus Saccharibacteria bacterium]|nr:hypothetical protein [Candidatus Saccharibacteria bacterium]